MTDVQTRTPYLDALEAYSRQGTLSFHVPGHKQGKGLPARFRALVGEQALKLEITQVLGLDDVHHPRNAVKEAQDLAALAYGARQSFFLVNGSSSGVQAMILSTCAPEEPVLVPRNAHKSVIGALLMVGARPVYVYPEYDYEYNIDHTPTLASYEQALEAHPDVRTVLLSSPTYYGSTGDVHGIVQRMHQLGRVVLVDEAWGPHLRFHEDLPMSALQAGADMVVNSTHKLAGAMSQGSMLHVLGPAIDVDRVQSVVRLFLSTSPSCLILASLDAARMQLATEGRELLGRTLALADHCRAEINRMQGLSCFGAELIGRPGVQGYDRTRICVQVKGLDMSGYEAEEWLRDHAHVQAEMSDLFNVVFLLTIGDRPQDIETLLDALRALSQAAREGPPRTPPPWFTGRFELPDWPPIRMTPREAFFSPSRRVPLRASAGFISAEIITPYPPGIPLLVPGEEITPDIIRYIEIELDAGIKVHGLIDEDEREVRVLDFQEY
ncbi:MAG TPA: aminotransferase class I/II-fold pyridoxal phosphate-dependent enzyme [Candidatus Xenobia bacterium]